MTLFIPKEIKEGRGGGERGGGEGREVKRRIIILTC